MDEFLLTVEETACLVAVWYIVGRIALIFPGCIVITTMIKQILNDMPRAGLLQCDVLTCRKHNMETESNQGSC